MKKLIFSFVLIFFAAINLSFSEDIDIYNANPVSAGNPNLLIVLDNASPNNGTVTQPDGSLVKKLEMIRQVMNLVLDPDPAFTYPSECGTVDQLKEKIKKINMGLMLFNPKSTSNGGYVRFHVRSMGNDTYRQALLDKINNPSGGTVVSCGASVSGLACPTGLNSDQTCTVTTTPATSTTTESCGNCNSSSWDGQGTCTKISLAGCSGNKGQRVVVTTAETSSYQICTTTTTASGTPAGIPTSDNAPYGKTMWEAYQYYSGQLAYRGFDSSQYDPAAKLGTTTLYNKPVVENCATNNILFVGTGGPDSAEEGDTANLLANTALCADTRLIAYPSGVNTTYQSNNLDEFSRRMSGTIYPSSCTPNPVRPKVITHGIMVRDAADTQPSILSAVQNLYNASKTVGGGEFYEAENGQAFLKGFCQTVNNVQAVNSAFASVTLPVSVNVSGTNLNQVYMGVFRPDENSAPRWVGNLKQYKIGLDSSGNGILVDSSATPKTVTNAATGFVNSDVVSYWTQSSAFWDVTKVSDKQTSDSPDGPLVEKGGVAQTMRTQFDAGENRNLYVCFKAAGCVAGSTVLSDNADSGTKFVAGGLNTNLTASVLGVATDTERDNLIYWIRGMDNAATVENTNPSKGASTVRPSIHGDVLHSRPAVVNYNRNGTDNDVFVFYGSNDGVYHAVKGGQGSSDGYEAWGIVFEEFLPRLKRLRDNSPLISSSNRKTYFADGVSSIYQFDANNDKKYVAADGDKVWLFISMRRGGRFVYALDVTTPESPKFMWAKGCPNLESNTGCSGGYQELGQTWSAPSVTNVYVNQTDTSGNAVRVKKPVLIFGAGYDPVIEDVRQEDISSRTNSGSTIGVGANSYDRSMGRGIFIVDAETGAVLTRIGPANSTDSPNIEVSDMKYAIPSDVTVLQRLRTTNNDGVVDRFYVGDTGGNVWRVSVAATVDFTDNATKAASFVVSKLASIDTKATSGTPSYTVTRKFLYPPDVVFGKDSNMTPYDAVLLGTGDRENPLSLVAADSYYMFKDYKTGRMETAGTTLQESNLFSFNCSFTQTTTSCPNNSLSNMDGYKGWMFSFPKKGERAVTSSLTAGGIVYFSTNTPPDYSSSSQCLSNLGQPTIYNINYQGVVDSSNTAAYPSNFVSSTSISSEGSVTQGLLPSPVRVVTKIGNKIVETILFGANPETPRTVPYDTRVKKYWYKRIEAAKP